MKTPRIKKPNGDIGFLLDKIKFPPPVIIGIDAALSGTGIAVFSENNFIGSMTLVPYKEVSGPLSPVLRGVAVTKLLNAINKNLNPSMYVMEGYAYNAQGKVFNIAEFVAVIKLFLSHTLKPLAVIPPAILKKYITGKGNADKDTVMYHIQHKIKQILDWDNNQADASVLCKIGYEIYKGQPPSKFKAEMAGCKLNGN